MSNIYLGYHFTVEPKELGCEILVAELGEKPFESFIETEFGVTAFVQKNLWSEDILDDIFILTSPEFTISLHVEEIEQVNWNEEWEKNFDAIDVDRTCYVRAPFHPKPMLNMILLLNPK